MAQRLRVADALERAALDIADQSVDPLQNCLVGCLPVQIIFPCQRVGES
jgi:hypothetical protein